MMTEKDGGQLIVNERKRQIEDEGWTTEHDDHHEDFELTRAARCYANHARFLGYPAPNVVLQDWPWGREWWKPEPRGVNARMTKTESIRMLVKAGALIAAEIDRLQRLPDAMPKEQEER